MPTVEVLLEGERRGLLNEKQTAILREARRRGLAPGPPIPEPQMAITRQSGDPLGSGQGLAYDLAKRADDFARATASGMTFGLADEAAAAANQAVFGGTYEDRLAAERARDAAMDPATRLVGEVTGALTTGTGLARGGLSFLRGASRTLPSLAGRGAAEGAAYGAAHGFGHGEGIEGRLKEAARGGATGAITGAGLGAITRGLVGGTARPTVENIKAQASEAYKTAEQAGVIVKSSALESAVNNIQGKIAKAGIDKTLHPNAMAAFNRLKEATANNQTLEGMEILRRVVKGAAASTNRDERRIAQIILGELDDFVGNLSTKDVFAGPTLEAVKSLKEARKLWHTASKAETIQELVERAGNRAGQFTGSGYENALRTEFRALSQNPKRLRQFTKAEQSFIKQVARGTPIGNALRWLGKLAPRGVVSTALSGGIGYGVGGPAGVPAALMAGEAGRAGATALTKANVQKVVDEILGPVTKGPVTINPQQAELLRGMLLTAIESERTAMSIPTAR